MNTNGQDDDQNTSTVGAQTSAEDAPKSIRDHIESALVETQQSDDKQPRAESGQFAVAPDKQPERTQAAANPATTDQAASTNQNQAPNQAEQQAPAPLKAPSTWNAAEREQWAALPDWAKQTVARREREAAQTITRHDEDRTLGAKVKASMAPYAPYIPQGMSADQVAESMLRAHSRMAIASPEQKIQLLYELGQSYGVDLQSHQAANPQGAAQNQEVADPRFQALNNQVGELTQRLERQTQQEQEQQQQQIMQSIEAFSSDPKNEFFNDVQPVMAKLIQSGLALNLQDAYDQATKLHGPAQEALRLRSASGPSPTQKRVQQAKNAASSVTGSPGQTRQGGAPTADRRSTIAAAAAELGIE